MALCKALGARLPGGDSLWSPSASRSSINGFNLYAYPAGGYFSVRKSSKRILFRASWRSPGGGAEILQGARPVRLPGGGLLLFVQK